ncbi:MAG: hypothetical protein IJX76_07090 [Clostridia bacterium]|nr:hypothetical protein [Clostridia bacterium]
MSNNKKNIPENDPLKAKFEGIDKQVRASADLKQAAKTGIPLRAGKKEGTAVHIRRFGKAVMAYAVIVMLVIGVVMFVPKLIAGNRPSAGSPVSGESAMPPRSTDEPVVTTTAAVVGITTTDWCPMDPPDIPDHAAPAVTTGIVTRVQMVPMDPYVEGSEEMPLAELLEGKVDLRQYIDPTSLRTNNITMWHEDGGLASWFDGSDNSDATSDEHEVCGGGVLSIGGGSVYFSLTEPMTVSAYALISSATGDIYTDRYPMDWSLQATNNPSGDWITLSSNYNGGMQKGSCVINGYTVNEYRKEAYQYYRFRIAYTQSGAIDLSELIIYADAE